eukprot:m.106870 g.106870  ORF g.106870 m.106870 type:complete len:340 (-) comp21120_c0_seq1:131-1150(-)
MACVVVGAGVQGLATAIALAEAGVTSIDLVSQDFPGETSAGSGALWRLVFYEGDPHGAQSKRTWDRLQKLEGQLGTGVGYCNGIELFTSASEPPPPWSDVVTGFTEHKGARAIAAALRTGVSADDIREYNTGHEFTSLMMNPPVYLGYLLQKAKLLGVRAHRKSMPSLDACEALFPSAAVFVNCTGSMAQALCDDTRLFRSKGQTVKVFAPDIRRFTVAVDGPLSLAYVLPRGDGTVVLGGTHHLDGERDATVGDIKAILNRCTALVPELESAQVIDVWGGFRPERQGGARIELEHRQSSRMWVHNYGHGGAGMTVHWGSAERAATLVMSALREFKSSL